MTARILLIDDNVENFSFFDKMMERKCPAIDLEWLPRMCLAHDFLAYVGQRRYELVICDIIGTAPPKDFWCYYRKIVKLCKEAIVTSGADSALPEWFDGEFVMKNNLVEYLKARCPEQA